MLHFPTEMGFLFHENSSNHLSFMFNGEYPTPFRVACVDYGTKKVKKVVEDVLVLVNRQNQLYNIDDDGDDDGDGDDAAKALIYAATNSAVHLDGVYFLLRREPGRYCRVQGGSRKKVHEHNEFYFSKLFDRMLLTVLSVFPPSIFSFPDRDKLANVFCLPVLRNTTDIGDRNVFYTNVLCFLFVAYCVHCW